MNYNDLKMSSSTQFTLILITVTLIVSIIAYDATGYGYDDVGDDSLGFEPRPPPVRPPSPLPIRLLEKILCKYLIVSNWISVNYSLIVNSVPNANIYAVILDAISKDPNADVGQACGQQLKMLSDGIKKKSLFAFKCKLLELNLDLIQPD